MRIGTCSWADEGLLSAWYPRGVSTAEKRLRYYAERFDVVEVDSPYYALPDPAVTERWARRTPDGFIFHVKASAAMTWHEGEPTDAAFRRVPRRARAARAVRASCAASCSSTTRASRSRTRRRRSSPARPERLAPLVPLVEFRHRSWMEEDERADTLAFLERARARVRVARQPAHARVERLAARRRGDAPRRVRPLPRSQRADVEHPRRRAPPTASTGSTRRRSSASGSSRSRGSPTRRRRSTRCSTTTATTSRRGARRSCAGCSTRRASPATGGVEPPPTELTLF